MHPDFLFFHEVGGAVRASIVDPHGHHLDDALPKLQALARFAAEYGAEFHRIESLTKDGATMRILDLQRADVRDAVLAGHDTSIEYYLSDLAVEYDVSAS